MDSIRNEQHDDSHEDLQGSAALAKIREIVKQADTCFFCTTDGLGRSMAARPMTVREVDDNGNLWFLSDRESHKNDQVNADSLVQLFFQGSSHSDFLKLNGLATVTDDRTRIEELWSPVAQNWFTEGVDDPRVTAIRIEPTSGHYWDTKGNRAVAGVKMLLGAALKKRMDVGVEGELEL